MELQPRLWSTLRPLWPLACVVGLIAVSIGLLERMKHHVLDQPEYRKEIKLGLLDPPEWIEREQWSPHILSTINVPPDSSLTDQELVQWIAKEFEASGWVRKVHRVNRQMDGTILVSCDYRRPIAMLHTKVEGKQAFVPVDRFGYRLPEIYEQIESNSGWIRILGVKTCLPAVNTVFEGEDAQAAVQLAALINDQGGVVASKISAVDVSNLMNPRDRRKSPILLWRVDSDYPIAWGSAIGKEMEEPSAEQKLANIATILKMGGPQAHVDVSTYPDGVIIPAANPPLQTADRSNGRTR